MAEGIQALAHQLGTAGKLRGVVRTMKALGAANIGGYEHAVHSLDGYYETVRLGLAACFGSSELPGESATGAAPGPGRGVDAGPGPDARAGWIIFGSDQGLVGQFNTVLLEAVTTARQGPPTGYVAVIRPPYGSPAWIVGERLAMEIEGYGFAIQGNYPAPISIDKITNLVDELLLAVERLRAKDQLREVYVCHNKPTGKTSFITTVQRLLPLGSGLWEELAGTRWPTRQRPDIIGGTEATGMALIREYLFVSLYKACAESLASENASRLAAMEHAEKNIEELSEVLLRAYHRLRQEAIDEELFDIVFGAEAIGNSRH